MLIQDLVQIKVLLMQIKVLLIEIKVVLMEIKVVLMEIKVVLMETKTLTVIKEALMEIKEIHIIMLMLVPNGDNNNFKWILLVGVKFHLSEMTLTISCYHHLPN
jgi:hypothetical protein